MENLSSSSFYPFSIPTFINPTLLPPQPPPPSAPPKKRGLRKDRHSKIRTSQGLRDRRMRLSLEVASEFFDIQDMLRFDKPSKTLRWLINAAKPAIDDLACVSGPTKPSPDSTSVESSATKSTSKAAVKRAALSRAKVGREERVKARERARERTMAKKRLLMMNFEESSSREMRSISAEEHCSINSSNGNEEVLPVTIFDYDLFHEQWEMERILQSHDLHW